MYSYIADDREWYKSSVSGLDDTHLYKLNSVYDTSSYTEFRISYIIKHIMDRVGSHKSLKNVVRCSMDMIFVDYEQSRVLDIYGIHLLQQAYLVHKLCTKWLYEGEFVYDESEFYNRSIELIERDEDPFSLENRVKECLEDCMLIESLFNTFEGEVC